jgi:nucleotide-binding universal stress UspA family protein
LASATTKIFNRILCPIDFDHSLKALDFAIQLAAQNDAGLTVLNVAPIPIGAAELTPAGETEPFWEVNAKAQLDLLAKQKLVGVLANYELITRSGDAAAGILRTEVDVGADLVVMATHGRRGISHFFVGSVAEQVVRESVCPVLTIRPE